MTKLSKAAQDDIVVELAVRVETLTEEEFDDLFDQLDAEHQVEVRQNVREFADRAVGTEHWDSDS
jgi:ribosomal protein S13